MMYKITLLLHREWLVMGKGTKQGDQLGAYWRRPGKAWTWETAVQMVEKVKFEIYFGGPTT